MQGRFAVVLGLTFLFSAPLEAAERKALVDVATDALTTQTQRGLTAPGAFDLAWWIPVEFWEAALSKDPNLEEAAVAEITETLRPYSILAIISADISVLGAFEFYDDKKVANGLSISYVPTDGGKPVSLEPLRELEGDLEVMIATIRPILVAAMGNMGQNLHFFVLPDLDRRGDRLVSPYEFGALEVTLGARAESPPVLLSIELPLDALFVPRLCENGKPAHVTWTHCPWGGSPLPE